MGKYDFGPHITLGSVPIGTEQLRLTVQRSNAPRRAGEARTGYLISLLFWYEGKDGRELFSRYGAAPGIFDASLLPDLYNALAAACRRALELEIVPPSEFERAGGPAAALVDQEESTNE